MSRFWTIVSVLCTLLLLTLGAFMPRLTAWVLDRQLEKEIMQRENADITLELSQNLDFFRTLDQFRSQQSQIQLTEGYRMTAEEITAAAERVIAAFGNVYSSPEVTPFLITNQDSPGLPGVFWRCLWVDTGGGQEILWLDDQSGQMVAFQGRVMVSTLATSVETTVLQDSVSVLEEFCRLNYPVDDVTIQRGEDSIGLGDYEMTLVRDHEGTEESYTVPLRFLGAQLYFNF